MRVADEKVTHPELSLRFLRFEVPRFAAPRHRHRHLELTWIERGSGLRYLGDDARPFAPDDLVLVGADVPHCWISARGSGASAATVVQFPRELLDDVALPELHAAARLTTAAGRGLSVSGEAAAAVRAHLVDMRGAGPLARLGLLFQALDVLATRAADCEPLAAHGIRPRSHPGRPARIDRVLDWVRRNYARPLRVEEAARIAHVSPGAFSRFFRREVGKPFVVYVNDVRCGEAQLRLRDHAARIEVVARDCGFPTLSNFNRHFRQRTGVSPREFRRRV